MEHSSNSGLCKISLNIPKYVRDIEISVVNKMKLVKKTSSDLLEAEQLYCDEILKIHKEAFDELISKTVTYSNLLIGIRNVYENAIYIRNKRISKFIRQDKIFGITSRKNEQEDKIKMVLNENENLRQQIQTLTFEISKLKNEVGKVKDEKFSEYLTLMKERDARYTLYFENLNLHLKLKELDGSKSADDVQGDPVILRIALDRCREQLFKTQRDLKKMNEDYAETVPRGDHEALETKYYDIVKSFDELTDAHESLQEKYNRLITSERAAEAELAEWRARCAELERAGTPRPPWELCADYIGGGRARWRQLARGLGSRDALRVLLRELGPAAAPDVLEHFDGLGLDPSIPPYLRYEGKVRNLRLSRREVAVIINDIWIGKINDGRGMSMQDYVTKYFDDRYRQSTVRAEWAYNLCSGAEQMLEEPPVKLFWGVLHGHLSEQIYLAHRRQWYAFRDALYAHSKDNENVTVEEVEKVAKATFPLKSEVDIKNLTDAVRKQLKLKMTSQEVNLDKLFLENEEGFDRIDLARELYRQRQLAQDKYIREVLAELGGKQAANKSVSVENLKRAFAIVDPAIDHIRMEHNIRWAFSDHTSELKSICPLSLRAIAARLAAGDIERVGPRHKVTRRHAYK